MLNRKRVKLVKKQEKTSASFIPLEKIFPLDAVQILARRVEEDAKNIEKPWYLKVFRKPNLSNREINKLGKAHGLPKKVIKTFKKFVNDPDSFLNDDEWFYPLQLFYIILAEKELNERNTIANIKPDPMMEIYLELRRNEIKNHEFKKRYFVAYRKAKLTEKILSIYVSPQDTKSILLYIEQPLSFKNHDEWFDPFQRLYINVVKSLIKLRESIGKNKKRAVEPADIFSGLKIDQPTKDILKLRIEAEIKARIDEQKKAFMKTAPLSTEKAGLELPQKAPKLYNERHLDPEDKDLDAKDFLDKYYGEYLKAGVIYQHHLRKLDPSLLKGIKNYCENRSIKFSSVVPPKKVEIDRKLAALTCDSKELNRMATNIRNRKKIKA